MADRYNPIQFTPEEEAVICAQYTNGIKPHRIAARFNRSPSVIRRVLAEKGLIRHYQQTKFQDRADMRDDMVQPVECKCPRCGDYHQKDLFWSGSVPARIRCPACEWFVTRGDGRFSSEGVSYKGQTGGYIKPGGN